MTKARYFLKDTDVLYRRKDGAQGLPDEVLWPRGRNGPAGWYPIIGQLTVSEKNVPPGSPRGGLGGGADPSLYAQLCEITETEALQRAAERGLPTDWATAPAEKPRTVNLNLVGLDGNAFALMGAFQKQARSEGWKPDEITAVLDRAKSGNYENLLSVLIQHCHPVTCDEDLGDESGWLT